MNILKVFSDFKNIIIFELLQLSKKLLNPALVYLYQNYQYMFTKRYFHINYELNSICKYINFYFHHTYKHFHMKKITKKINLQLNTAISIFLLFSYNTIIGKILFVHGTACAGKTSLCHEFIQQNPEWCLIEEDSFYFQELNSFWSHTFFKEFTIIQEAISTENIFHAIVAHKILFKSDATNEQRLQAKNAILTIQKTLNDSKLWENILNNIRQKITQIILQNAEKKDVIVDTWLLLPENIKKIKEYYQILHIIAFSSFSEIIQRTMKRNYQAFSNGTDISNFRFFRQTLFSFEKKYDLSNNPDKSIAIIDKNDVIHTLDLVEMQLQNFIKTMITSQKFPYQELSLEEFFEYKKKLLSKFTSDKAYVITRLPFDGIIKTDNCSPIQAANELTKFIL